METDNITRIEMLPMEKIVFVKKINLESTRMSGILCYARKLYKGYSFKTSNKNKQEGLILGHNEDEYPKDALDIKILEQVYKQFPNAECQTSLLMFDIEKVHNKHLMSQLRGEVMHISLEYIPSSFPPFGAEVYQRNVEIYYYPLPDERLNRLNENINIVVDDLNEYKHLKSLLCDTYELFSNVCK